MVFLKIRNVTTWSVFVNPVTYDLLHVVTPRCNKILTMKSCVIIAMYMFAYRFDLEVDKDHVVERYAIAVLKALNGIKLKLNHISSL